MGLDSTDKLRNYDYQCKTNVYVYIVTARLQPSTNL